MTDKHKEALEALDMALNNDADFFFKAGMYTAFFKHHGETVRQALQSASWQPMPVETPRNWDNVHPNVRVLVHALEWIIVNDADDENLKMAENALQSYASYPVPAAPVDGGEM
jgi:hypothetical protein